MGSAYRLGAGVVALLLCWRSDARACDPSYWTADDEGGCLTVDTSSESAFRITNDCDETVVLTEVDCSAACAPSLTLEPAESGVLDPSSPHDAQKTARFRYELEGEEFALRFAYHDNVCPDEGGCTVGGVAPRVSGAQTFVLLALGWSLRRARRQR